MPSVSRHKDCFVNQLNEIYGGLEQCLQIKNFGIK